MIRNCPSREAPGQRSDRKRQSREGHWFVSYWLGVGCSGMMTGTSGWGGLFRVEKGPRTTAPVPCHSSGSASPGPLYSYRTSSHGCGCCHRVQRQAWRAGKEAREKWCGCITMFLLHGGITMYHNVSQANSNLIKIHSFCTEKRLLSMPLADHTSPRVALPSWHPRRLAAPPGLRGLLF